MLYHLLLQSPVYTLFPLMPYCNSSLHKTTLSLAPHKHLLSSCTSFGTLSKPTGPSTAKTSASMSTDKWSQHAIRAKPYTPKCGNSSQIYPDPNGISTFSNNV